MIGNMSRFVAKTLFCCFFMCTMAPLYAKDFVVFIDPGHGGKDPGAVGAISKEKDINLSVALEVGRLISNNIKDVKVLYSRKTDVFIELDDRAHMANRANADLFISIHANAVESKPQTVQGVETYTLGTASSAENLAVAKRENAVIMLEKDYEKRYNYNPKAPESVAMYEFMQSLNVEQSVHFASLVQRQMKGYCKRVDKGVRQAGFLVLRATSMTSVLVELGYMSHREEERYISSTEGISKLSESIYRAFRQYKSEYDVRVKGSSSITSADIIKVADESTSEKEVAQALDATPSPVSANPSKPAASASSSSHILFKVQIIASNTPIKKGSAQFKGLNPVGFYEEGGYYKYTYDENTDYNKVYRTRKEILSKFPSAFIVAFRDGEKMDINQAIRIFKANTTK